MTAYERRSSSSFPARITAQALHALVACDREIALLDVRERGEFAAGHLFLASSVPMSRFEPELLRLDV